MEVSSATSVGRIRPLNEDSYFVSEPDQSGTVLAIVADGMGGHNAGEVASGKAVGIVQKDVLGKCGKNAKDVLVKAVNDANREIYEMSVNARNLSGMGTTMTACVAEEHNVTAVQVGDSRLYLIRGEKITQITKDHSLVEMLLENGKITKEEARRHPQKNIITRAVGTDKTVEADIYEFRAEAGDVILLCSDGLSNEMADQEMLFEVVHGLSKSDCCQRLLHIAKNRGAPDNVTVTLAAV